jgi:hypothetical protein
MVQVAQATQAQVVQVAQALEVQGQVALDQMALEAQALDQADLVLVDQGRVALVELVQVDQVLQVLQTLEIKDRLLHKSKEVLLQISLEETVVLQTL